MPKRRYEDKALEFASIKHKGQKDTDGRPYFFAHVIQVYDLLQIVSDDDSVISAGILHEVIEKTNTTYEELVHEFNQEIADLVWEVTYEEDEGGHYYPRLNSKKGILIRFADRLSRISRIDDWPGDVQENYLQSCVFWRTKRKDN
ncbi:HD domain-containing protein [Candidatus Bathyarchaeota archaeon]|nr:HD domain-containing protein [Candidatus Bathyarchaeota archaeon]